jgi:hypothetical protein
MKMGDTYQRIPLIFTAIGYGGAETSLLHFTITLKSSSWEV